MEHKEFPERITLELTNRCNLDCTFCPRHLVDMDLGNMEWDLFQKIIDESAMHLPITLVLFFRGESLIHPDLIKMISYAKEKGIGPIQLASNGFLLTEEVGKGIIEAGLDFISFSLDTIRSEVYQKTRINSDLKIAMHNVLRFVELCEEEKKKGGKVPEIQVSSVDVSDYKEGKASFIDFWRKHADRVRIYIEHSSDGNLGSIKADLSACRDRRLPCKKVHEDMVIYWDGTAALCNHDWDNCLSMGDANCSKIATIWNSSAYDEVRKMHDTGRFSPGIVCAKCDHWKMYYMPEGFVGEVYGKVCQEG